MKETEINEIMNKLNLSNKDKLLFKHNLYRCDRKFIERLNDFVVDLR